MNVFEIIALAGLLCGTLDFLMTSTLFKLRGGTYENLLQFIASGALGPSDCLSPVWCVIFRDMSEASRAVHFRHKSIWRVSMQSQSWRDENGATIAISPTKKRKESW